MLPAVGPSTTKYSVWPWVVDSVIESVTLVPAVWLASLHCAVSQPPFAFAPSATRSRSPPFGVSVTVAVPVTGTSSL